MMVQEEFEEKKKMIDEFVNSKGYRSMSIKEMAMVLQVPSCEGRPLYGDPERLWFCAR